MDTMRTNKRGKYTTVKIPIGLLERVRKVIEIDESFLNVSDYVRTAIRNMLERSQKFKVKFVKTGNKNGYKKFKI